MWINQSCDCVLPGNQRVRFIHAGRETYRSDDWKHFHKLSPHSHDLMHLLIYLEGENVVQCGGQRIEWKAPAGILTDSHVPHEVRPVQPGAVEYLQVTLGLLDDAGHVRSGSWSELARALGAPGIQLEKITPQQWQRAIPDLLGAVKGLVDQNPLVLSARLMALIAELSSEPAQEIPASLFQIQEAIERNPGSDWNPEKLAAVQGWSTGYLHRNCRTKLGCTPMEWVFQLRLQRACMLLTEGSLDLAGIAEICGFADAYHLSRRFKGYYGMPPGVWRRQHSGV